MTRRQGRVMNKARRQEEAMLQNPNGIQKRKTLNSRKAKNVVDEPRAGFARAIEVKHSIEYTPSINPRLQTIPPKDVQASGPDVAGTFADVSQLAEIVRDLQIGGNYMTKSVVVAAIKLLELRGWTVDDLKSSEPFGDKAAKLGLEKIQREIVIYQHIGAVSSQILKQEILNTNELNVLREVVVFWAGLGGTGQVKALEKLVGPQNDWHTMHIGKRLKALIEAHKEEVVFKYWTFGRLKDLGLRIRIKTEEVEAETDQIIPDKQQKTRPQTTVGFSFSSSTPDSIEAESLSESSQDNYPDLDLLTYFEENPFCETRYDERDSESMSMTEEEARVEAGNIGGNISQYLLGLEREKARILNTILHKHNVLKNARDVANRAKDWNVDTAVDPGDMLFHSSTHAQEGVEEGLLGPLDAEIQARDDLADYLTKSPDSAILTGVNAVLKELIPLRELLTYG